MKAGIIAAGNGARLRLGGWEGSKAMVPVGGRPLIDHALDRFSAAGFDEVSLLINDTAVDCKDHIQARGGTPKVDLLVRSTPSSFASFELMGARLAGEKAVITTIDSIMPPAAFTSFLASADCLPPGSLGLGVTPHVDDESPLWVDIDLPHWRIRRVGGETGEYATAGLYVLPERALPPSPAPFSRLRDYLAWLAREGHVLYGIELPLVFDVDRPEDIVQATRALASWSTEDESHQS